MKSNLPATKFGKIVPVYEKLLLRVLDEIIARYERNPDYHFIDTKLNIITGRDFADDDPCKGKNVIFSWIQGRGLEALAGHAEWLRNAAFLSAAERQKRIDRIQRIIVEVTDAMESCRAANNGRLFFSMTPTGEFLQVINGKELRVLDTVKNACNFSDLFYSKGLMAAAALLRDGQKLAEAEQYFAKVVEDIREERFYTDQQAFDPGNPVEFVPGKKQQGPFMIALSGTAIAAAYCDRDKWLNIARSLIEHNIACHLNTGQYEYLQKYDYWEAIDEDNQPWRDSGRIVCDPGHALEFAGLALKNLLMMKDSGIDPDFVKNCGNICRKLLKHNFAIGFAAGPGGIVKTFDLLARRPLNSDMPWWSLPETVRAAMEAYALTNDAKILEIADKSSKAFLTNYVNHEACGMAYQTRDSSGKVINIVPATPDADPGYHTGLSIIDALRIII